MKKEKKPVVYTVIQHEPVLTKEERDARLLRFSRMVARIGK